MAETAHSPWCISGTASTLALGSYFVSDTTTAAYGSQRILQWCRVRNPTQDSWILRLSFGRKASLFTLAPLLRGPFFIYSAP